MKHLPAKTMPRADKTREVCCFRAARIDAGAFDPAQEFVVCPWGTVQTRRGPVTVNEKTLNVFAANQARRRRDKVAGDFKHNSLLVPLERQPVNVTGYFTVRVERGVGIIAKLSHETPHMAAVREGNYPDISPAIERDAAGVVESLHSFAFCAQGEMAHPDLEIFSVPDGVADNSTQTTNTMTDAEMLAELLSALTGEDIAADASPEIKAAALAKAKANAAKAAPAAMSAEAAPEITALAAELAGLKKTVEAFTAGEELRKVDALIADAARAGKQIGIKRERLAAMGAEGCAEYLDSLTPGVVKADPNGSVAAANKGKGQTVTDVFSAEVVAMWRRNGIDPAEMLKAHLEREAEAAGSAAE